MPMLKKLNVKVCLIVIVVNMSSCANAADQQTSPVYPCADGSILTYFKRPTVITSACPVPLGMFTVEGGLQYNEFIKAGEGWTYPQSKVRAGLPWRSEFSVILPNENTNSHTHKTGLSFTQLALKHNIAYNDYWNTAARVIYIPASGSKYYGTEQDGYTLSGILAYRIKNINITAMASVASLSTSKADGGKRFNSFNPDISIGWFANQQLELYAEVYGQTHTAPNQGAGYNLDTGLLFLVTKYIAADIEIGRRLYGQLGNFNTYLGSGISFMF